MATHSSILAWKIPWMEKPGGLQSVVSQESDTTERLRFHFDRTQQNSVKQFSFNKKLINFKKYCIFKGVKKLAQLKTYVHTKTCTQMFIAALFEIAKSWKQPRCPSVGDGGADNIN